jgi:hypothetical protein
MITNYDDLGFTSTQLKKTSNIESVNMDTNYDYFIRASKKINLDEVDFATFKL